MPVPDAPHPLAHRPALRALLDKLHQISLAQEGESHNVYYPADYIKDNAKFEDKLIALDEDKAGAIYLLLRAMGAKRVVEAGTSYGVSLLWLLAAVVENDEASPSSSSSLPPLLIGTELLASKAAIARKHVEEGFGGSIPSCLKVLEGDLLETLPAANIEDSSIDALLLDIWAPLALPTLKNLIPKFRKGAVVFIDNTVSSKERYIEILSFLRAEGSGFRTTVLPYSGGMEMAVYVG
ncbi:hypothetical protein JCM8547_008130 [Rhodosporidiobolus lusitaniae]